MARIEVRFKPDELVVAEDRAAYPEGAGMAFDVVIDGETTHVLHGFLTRPQLAALDRHKDANMRAALVARAAAEQFHRDRDELGTTGRELTVWCQSGDLQRVYEPGDDELVLPAPGAVVRAFDS